jgi:hypothetical protein
MSGSTKVYRLGGGRTAPYLRLRRVGMDILDSNVRSDIHALSAVIEGGYDLAVHRAAAVTTTATEIVPVDPERRYLLLQNVSDTAIWLGFGQVPVPADSFGLKLAAGAERELSLVQGNLFLGFIMAVHAGTGSKVLLVTAGGVQEV